MMPLREQPHLCQSQVPPLGPSLSFMLFPCSSQNPVGCDQDRIETSEGIQKAESLLECLG